MTDVWPLLGLMGLVLGSFANVAVHRLPRMVMQREEANTYNLSHPASHCPICRTPLRWQDNIPVLSFVLLQGRCAHCKAKISWRYPAIEFATAALWLLCAWHWPSPQAAVCWALCGTALLTLAIIDWDTTLLPDAITQPLLWLGLLASLNGWITTPLELSVTGAMAGYLSLWIVACAFERLTHKEGMGAGDFKLFAAIGAWLGPWLLWPVLLLASFMGIVVGLGLKMRGQLREGGYIPFGPFLAACAAGMAWWSPSVFDWLLLA